MTEAARFANRSERSPQPRTAAGRKMLDLIYNPDSSYSERMVNRAILAIEAEAIEEGMLRQLDRHQHEEQNPGRSVTLGPEAEQRGGLDWPTLSNVIREVDGNHDLGAGELAERILRHPKVADQLAPQPSAERATAQRTVPPADPATDGKHGAIGKHYPRTAGALKGFLGGPTETQCGGCGVPMFLKDGKWRASSPPAESEPDCCSFIQPHIGTAPLGVHWVKDGPG